MTDNTSYALIPTTSFPNSLHISGLSIETNENDLILFFKDYKVISVKLIQ